MVLLAPLFVLAAALNEGVGNGGVAVIWSWSYCIQNSNSIIHHLGLEVRWKDFKDVRDGRRASAISSGVGDGCGGGFNGILVVFHFVGVWGWESS